MEEGENKINVKRLNDCLKFYGYRRRMKKMFRGRKTGWKNIAEKTLQKSIGEKMLTFGIKICCVLIYF